MAPIGFASERVSFDDLRGRLSEVMIFHGFAINAEGRAQNFVKAGTFSEGAKLSRRLHAEPRHRGAHTLPIEYCSEELVTSPFVTPPWRHPSCIPARIRRMTGMAGDGDGLYNQVFGTGLRRCSTSNLRDGVKNQCTPRIQKSPPRYSRSRAQPWAHSSRIDSQEHIDDSYDVISLFSCVHRRLDGSSRQLISD
jgi:hypothetical protein